MIRRIWITIVLIIFIQKIESLITNSIFHSFHDDGWRHLISVKNMFIIEEQLCKSVLQLVKK